ncbi:MAG: hypothetical protein WA001_01485 [Patescibacteria group bacterium]
MREGSYAFIYDDIVNDRKYERELAAIELRLTSLDIQGRVARLSLFRSAKDLVESMVGHGVTTLVIFGNDRSLDKMMWFLPDMNVTVGYVPIAGPSDVASLLGIPIGVAACDVLSARLVETVDMGRIDDRYFLTEISITGSTAAVDIEGRYRVSSLHRGTISIRNLGRVHAEGQPQSDAKDGMLEVVIASGPEAVSRKRHAVEPAETRILIRSGEIISADPVDVRVDDHVLNGFHFSLGVAPSKLKFITGRSRKLAPLEVSLQKNVNRYTLPAATLSVR